MILLYDTSPSLNVYMLFLARKKDSLRSDGLPALLFLSDESIESISSVVESRY